MPLQIIRKDITKMTKCDAIVNTTNREMIGYSGVDWAIHAKAGPKLDLECEKLAPLELGHVKITQGYDLGCKYIIHTSGPIWLDGHCREKTILRGCYIQALKLAKKYGCQSIAFPLISSGTNSFPKDQVLTIAVQAISAFLEQEDMDVYLCVYDEKSYELSQKLKNNVLKFLQENGNDDLSMSMANPAKPSVSVAPEEKLEEFLKKKNKSFADTLFQLMDERKIVKDSDLYHRANVDKRVFSKLRSNVNYKPSKQTALAFAIALKLSWGETQDFLATAGLALSHNNDFDMIVEYFIKKKKYDIIEINIALFDFKQKTLGSQ